MKSIKPGRGPSMQGFAGSIAAIVFGVFWTIMAFSITQDSPFAAARFFPFFGFVFIGLGIFQAVYHYKNATEKNRMSLLDIVDSNEEPDPLNAKFARPSSPEPHDGAFCPYCGKPVRSDFQFCPACGKSLSL